MDIKQIWEEYSSTQINDDIESLRKVIDRNDLKGIKNSYIDFYLKYYLLKYLDLKNTDSTFEIGSGIGRNVEYVSRFVKDSYGIDLIDNFINDCKNNPNKAPNSEYFYISQKDEIKNLNINKLYTIWVLMCIQNNNDLLEILKDYKSRLNKLQKTVFIEQVKENSDTNYYKGAFFCYYRTLEEYINIFKEAGFNKIEYVLLGERTLGLIPNLIFNTAIYKILPKSLIKFANFMFHFDKFLFNIGILKRKTSKIVNDVVFILE